MSTSRSQDRNSTISSNRSASSKWHARSKQMRARTRWSAHLRLSCCANLDALRLDVGRNEIRQVTASAPLMGMSQQTLTGQGQRVQYLHLGLEIEDINGASAGTLLCWMMCLR